MIWDEIGVYVGDPNAWDSARIDSFLGRFKGGGGSYALVQTSNGPGRHPEEKVRLWKDGCARRDVRFGIWTVTYEDPVGEARLAADDVRRYRPEAIAINAESPYMGDPRVSADEKARWEKSARFVSTFQNESLGGYTPALALSTLGAASGEHVYWLQFERWRDAGFHLHAQAYFNAFDDYRPDRCVAHAQRAGWPLDKVAVTLGTYKGEDPPRGKGLNSTWPTTCRCWPDLSSQA